MSAFSVSARNANGTVDEAAASHPFALDVHFAVNTDQEGEPEGVLRNLQIALPSGLVGNPLNVPRCPLALFQGETPRCPGSSQVGVLRGEFAGLGLLTFPIYNLAPSPGDAGAFAASLRGEAIVQRLRLTGAGDASSIQLESTVPPQPAVVDVEEEIWGVPADSRHDPARICLSPEGGLVEGCSSGAAEKPLLTLPASCAAPMRTDLYAVATGPLVDAATAFSRDAGGNARPLSGCESVPFEPRFSAELSGFALAPTSLRLGLEVPHYDGPVEAAAVGGVKLELPSGLALNPSAGAWVTGCPSAAVGPVSAQGAEAPVLDASPAACPSTSRIGSVRVDTPLIDHALAGAIYLGEPGTNPFGARYAIYLAIEDDATGTILKIPGSLEPDPGDGRLTVNIPAMPQLPFDDLTLEIDGGARSPLAAPPNCGRYSAEAIVTPSTSPFRQAVVRTSSFAVSAGSDGAACPPAEAKRKAAPAFRAGTEVAHAGGSSPLTIRIARADSDQHLGRFDLTLPPGLIGSLGTVQAGEAIGSAKVEAGIGPEPVALEGIVHLGGPYRGAPYSLETVVPARAGPFDLGTIVQRAALDVDPVTGQIGVRSDPLPQILGGVPLELRSIDLRLDRPGFIRNPTSCEPMAIAGSATTSLGQTVPISDRFQVGGCAALPFKPRLSLAVSGAVGRGGHPAVRAVFRGDPSGAAASGIAFRLPAGELLDLRHLGRLCPRDVAVARCPRGARLGSLRIDTPLLDAPLEGPVYLRVPSGRLPGLTAEVRSGGLHFLLRGRVTGRGGRLGVSLESLPDVPLSRAVLRLPGGRRGLVVNSESLCRGKRHAIASFSAHSGKQRSFRLRPQVVGCSRKR